MHFELKRVNLMRRMCLKAFLLEIFFVEVFFFFKCFWENRLSSVLSQNTISDFSNF